MPDRLLITLLLLLGLTVALSLARLIWERWRQGLVLRLRTSGAGASGDRGEANRILYFTTEQCVQCRELQEPALERLRSIWPSPLVIEKVNAIERRDLADRYKVMTVPTTAIFDNQGQLLEINYGYAPLEKLASQLAAASGTSPAPHYEI